MSQQIIIHIGERIALRELQYRGQILHSVLVPYDGPERGLEISPWSQDEPPHTLYYSGSWQLNADPHQPLLIKVPVIRDQSSL